MHGNLSLFSMQGLEKLNSFSKLNYFRSTNHNKNTLTSTLLRKINILYFIHLNADCHFFKFESILIIEIFYSYQYLDFSVHH